VVRLSLAKNVAYNIVNEKTTFGLIKALSNMYEKPSATNKVFLIRQLVNLKMKEGGSVTDHVNEFNSIISRLISVDIKFEDEVQALLLLSSLPDSWSGTITAVSSSTGSAKLSFEGIRDLILGEDMRRRSAGESSSSLLNTEDRGRSLNKRDGGRGKSKMRKRSQSKNRKDITCWNYDALICCVENSTESWIMDSGASFHASHSRDVMQNFRHYKGKVRLADNKSLDITGVGDVILKTTLGTNWTLKNVKFIPDLKRMLISVGQLDDEGHHVTFVSDAEVHAVEKVGASTLWHQRLGQVRIHYAPCGLNPPHTHPRATEILTGLEGNLQVGFVTSNPDNCHVSKVLQKGDVFVFPVGLVHYQHNVGNGNAVVIAALSSQNPGAITIENVVFGANPPIASDVLSRAFQVDKSVVDFLQAKF
nr:retrovirus-related Pol polyprotein from transposon TNT 1-94 [Tanacetum cinerariifolium]